MMPEKSPLLRVLIVDDESLIRWSMAETLSHAGWDVIEAGNAKEAMERLSSDPPPDVILLASRVPDSNALTLLDAIRRTRPTSRVVMMTAFGTPAMQAGARQAAPSREREK